MRNLRWAAGAALIVWLIWLARRQALRRGRRALALALPFLGLAAISFLLSLASVSPAVSNALIGVSLLSVALFIGLVLWQGFR